MRSRAEQWIVVGCEGRYRDRRRISTKAGGALEIKFDELGTWNAATKTFTPDSNGTFKRVKPLDRSAGTLPD